MSKYTKEQLEEVGKILGLPRQKRWRAAADFTIRTNSWAKLEHDYFSQEIKQARAGLKNEQGRSEDKNSSLRWGLRIPETIHAAIKMFDPEFDSEKGRTPESREMQKRELRQMMETFPEYRIPSKI